MGGTYQGRRLLTDGQYVCYRAADRWSTRTLAVEFTTGRSTMESREREAAQRAGLEEGPGAAPRGGIEDFLGGRVLAWAGSATVLLGVVLLVAVAIGRGWIDEPTRIAIAFAGSAAMLTAGAWLYERRGRTQAAMLATGTGLSGLFLTFAAGVQLYHLYPAPIALIEVALVGFVGTVLALRWDSPAIAALSSGGALLAPLLVGADPSEFTMGFLLIALACSVGVLTLKRWNWLAVGCFFVAAPQLLAWVATKPGPLDLTIALSAYALVNAGAALGYELRVKSEGLRPASTLLVLAGGLFTAGAGYWGFREIDHGTLAEWWVAAVAVAHLTAGVLALRSSRIGHEIALVTLGAGTVLADIAFGTIADGPVVAAGWAASAAALAFVARRRPRDIELTRLTLGAQLTLALGHLLLFDAAPNALLSGVHDLPGALVAIGSVAMAAFLVARLDGTSEALSIAYDGIAIAALAYASDYALDGPALVAAWAGTSVALATTIRRERLGLAAAGTFAGMAAVHVLAYEAPLGALIDGVPDLAGSAAALAGVGA